MRVASSESFIGAGTRVPRSRKQTSALALWIRDWGDAFRAAPAFSFALALYMALPTTAIFPEVTEFRFDLWHPSHFGWYDLVYIGLLGATLIFTRSKIPASSGIVCLAFLLLIVSSFVSTSPEVRASALSDAVIYWLRFAAGFVCAVTLTRAKGAIVVEKNLLGVALILMASSIFVLRLQYGIFNRMYASGMTVGSFSQVVAVVFLVAMLRNRLGIMVVSLLFLILTFSRTAISLWAMAVGYYLLWKARLRFSQRVFYGGIVVSVFTLSTIVLIGISGFRFVIDERLDLEEILSLNRRTELWQWGVDLLASGSVPLSGIGFNTTPSELRGLISISPDNELQTVYAQSFHSIVFEFLIGLGLMAIPIFAFLICRIWEAWRKAAFLPLFIYGLFLLSQSVDFSFYRPKEVVIWGVFLGLAEGELLSRRQRRRQPVGRRPGNGPPSAMLESNSAPAG